MVNKPELPLWKKVVTWVSRLVVGTVFIVSGFVKGVDPWGTIYKITDYFAVWGLDIPEPILVVLAFALCGFEFLMGVFVFFGCYRRGAPLFTFLLMLFMTPLTLWIAIAEPVADCGCFGDAIILDNWTTFWKNTLLLAMSGWLVVYARRIHWFITPALQWFALVAAGTFIVYIEFVGYSYQPLLDFRPYKVGQPIFAADTDMDDIDNVKFVYEKEGERKEFGIDDELPDEAEGWVFVDRIDKGTNASSVASDADFRIFSNEEEGISSEDVTEDVLTDVPRQMILFFSELGGQSIASSYKINSMYDWAVKNDIDFIAVVAATHQQIEDWQDISMAQYPIYTAEDTQIKQIVRGNPAVVYLHNGNVAWKSSLAWIAADDFIADNVSADPELLAHYDRRLFMTALWILAGVMASLMLMSFTPGFWSRFRNRYKKSPADDNSGKQDIEDFQVGDSDSQEAINGNDSQNDME